MPACRLSRRLSTRSAGGTEPGYVLRARIVVRRNVQTTCMPGCCPQRLRVSISSSCPWQSRHDRRRHHLDHGHHLFPSHRPLFVSCPRPSSAASYTSRDVPLRRAVSSPPQRSCAHPPRSSCGRPLLPRRQSWRERLLLRTGSKVSPTMMVMSLNTTTHPARRCFPSAVLLAAGRHHTARPGLSLPLPYASMHHLSGTHVGQEGLWN